MEVVGQGFLRTVQNVVNAPLTVSCSGRKPLRLHLDEHVEFKPVNRADVMEPQNYVTAL